MPYYGPWEQAPDFDKDQSVRGGGAFGRTTAVVEGPTPSNEELNQAIGLVGGSATIDGFTGGLTANLVIGLVDHDVGGGTAELNARGDSGGAWWGSGVDPDLLLDFPALPPPPGAIGLERESLVCAPLAAILTYARQHDVTAELLAAPTTVTLTAGSVVGSELVVADSWDYDVADQGTGPDRELNLTTHMDPVTADVSLRVIAAKTVGKVWAYVDPADPETCGSSVIMADPVMTYTLRPPRHRWIYDTAPVRRLPPCRIYPGGATGNNSRIYPPSKVQQRSNRKSDPY